MKKDQIQVGQCYLAKVSNNVVPVRVTGIDNHPRTDAAMYHVINLKTGRKTTFQSATRFRCPCDKDGSIPKRGTPEYDALPVSTTNRRVL